MNFVETFALTIDEPSLMETSTVPSKFDVPISASWIMSGHFGMSGVLEMNDDKGDCWVGGWESDVGTLWSMNTSSMPGATGAGTAFVLWAILKKFKHVNVNRLKHATRKEICLKSSFIQSRVATNSDYGQNTEYKIPNMYGKPPKKRNKISQQVWTISKNGEPPPPPPISQQF